MVATRVVAAAGDASGGVSWSPDRNEMRFWLLGEDTALGGFRKMYRARVGDVEGLLCKIDVAPLNMKGVVWIDFAHGSSAPCAQIRCPQTRPWSLEAACMRFQLERTWGVVAPSCCS
jgi:hypothetical protein